MTPEETGAQILEHPPALASHENDPSVTPDTTGDAPLSGINPAAFFDVAFAPVETGYVVVCGSMENGAWADDLRVVPVREAGNLASTESDQYFTVHPRKTPRRESEINTDSVVMLPIDFDSSGSSDGKDPAHSFQTIKEVYSFLDGALPCPPSAIIDSGHGWHVYYFLAEPLHPVEGKRLLTRLKRHMQSQAETMGKSLDSVFDLSRVMRIPGSINGKNGDRTPTHVVELHPDRRYSLDDFDFLPHAATPPLNSGTATITANDVEKWTASLPSGVAGTELIDKWCNNLRGAVRGSPNEGRHHTALIAVGQASIAAQRRQADFNLSVSKLKTVWDQITTARSGEFDDIVRYVIAQRMADRDEDPSGDSSEQDSSWPPLQRIEKSELPDLPLEHIPPALRDITIGVANAVQVDPALSFTVAIGTLSAAVAGGAIASPMPTWSKEPLSLWVFGVADPSERKTAVYSRITAALRDAMHSVADRDASKKAVMEAEFLLAKQHHRKALKAGDAESLGDAVQRVAVAEAELKKHPTPNFIVQDPTPEALEQLMERQAGVAFVTSDEGTFIENLAGRHTGSAPVLGMVNSAWSGQAIRSIRVSRGDTSIDHPFLPMSALIQPEVATKLAARAFVGTGFVSRVLAAYPNPRAGNRPLGEAVELPWATIGQWEELIRTTLNKYWQQNTNPTQISFDPQAKEVLISYQRMTDRNCARRELGGMSTWWGKAHGHAVRIAALFAIAKGLDVVDGDTVRDAVAITDWYSTHMAHLFDIAIEADADLGDQERILRWIERHREEINGDDSTFTTRRLQRDLVRKGRSMERREDLEAPLDALQHRGYLRAVPGGKDRSAWQVRPELLQR